MLSVMIFGLNKSVAPEGKACLFIVDSEKRRSLECFYDEFAREYDGSRPKMAAECPSVFVGKGDMGMNHWCAVFYGDVSGKF